MKQLQSNFENADRNNDGKLDDSEIQNFIWNECELDVQPVEFKAKCGVDRSNDITVSEFTRALISEQISSPNANISEVVGKSMATPEKKI